MKYLLEKPIVEIKKKETQGCGFHKHAKKYRAQIRIKGKVTHLGYFDTKEEAHEAYVKAISARCLQSTA